MSRQDSTAAMRSGGLELADGADGVFPWDRARQRESLIKPEEISRGRTQRLPREGLGPDEGRQRDKHRVPVPRFGLQRGLEILADFGMCPQSCKQSLTGQLHRAAIEHRMIQGLEFRVIGSALEWTHPAVGERNPDE
jgi:hypothetical protein